MQKNGFTLIEILIVISVLALLLSISIPSTARFSARQTLSASTKTLASQLRATQSQAVLQHKTLSLDPTETTLASGIKFKKVKPITFSSSGLTPPGGSGTLILQNRFGQSKKIIVASSGRVRIE